MKKDESDLASAIKLEIDDEGNLGHHNDGAVIFWSSSSSCSSSSSRGDCNGEDPDPYQTTWPQSYRQSIDVFSSELSQKVELLKDSGFARVSNSFIRSSFSFDREELNSPTQSLLPRASERNHVGADLAFVDTVPPKISQTFSSYNDLPPTRQCSTAQALVNGMNVLCGVGILSIPYAVKEGGWLGLILLFGMGSISFYTGILLKRCLDSSPGLKTYPDIGHAAFGLAGRVFISIVLYLELYGCCVEFITMVGDNLESIFPNARTNFLGFDLSAQQSFAVATAIVVLPTVWLRNLSLLSYISAGGVFLSILVTICLLWVGVVDKVGFHSGGTALNLVDLPIAIGLYGFCYSGHSVFPNIYSSMKNPSRFPIILLICFILSTILYSGVATAGYLIFGDSLKSQFTLNMPHQYLSSQIAVWTTVISPLTKYALTITPIALSIEELLPSSGNLCFIMVLIRTLLVLSTLVVALTFPYFAYVMALLGSVFAMLLALILPCACYLSIKRKSATYLQVSVCTLIIMVAVASSFIGSYSSIKQMLAQ
ncbi:amino acid transporter AVT1C-like [Zingiber officinale]|uniref:amino acid transporter AVT1C-like n=1 Tax=Zingiber officinale TaxID=94328 RepID=UPI001C4B66FE|nr:amino acid transporter AVT1C-like [Zingiber officinale]